ncbi:ArnT family glycosyltransferase [Candidatus Omnitrophota bacterium]
MLKKKWRWLLALFVVSFLIRFCFSVMYVGFNADPHDPRFQLSDSTKYHNTANMLLQEHTFGGKSQVPPGYPIFLALIYFLFGTGFGAVQIIQALLSALLCIIIFDIAREIFDDATAWLAGIISAGYPFFIYWSGMLISETLFIVFYVAAFNFILKYSLHKKQSMNILGAICLAIAALIRPVALPFIGFVMLGYIFTMKTKWQKSLLNTLVFVIIFSAVMAPWIVRNYILFNRIVPGTTQSGLMLLNGMNSKIIKNPTNVNTVIYTELDEYKNELRLLHNESELNQKAADLAIKYYKDLIIHQPKLLFKIILNKFLELWDIIPKNKSRAVKIVSALSFGILMPFACVGLYFGIRKRRSMFFILAAFLNTCILGVIFVPTIRYRFPLEPFYVIVASYGLLTIYKLLPWSSIQTNKELSHNEYT